MLIERDRSLLLVVDVQERLLPAMAEPDKILANCKALLSGGARLGVPVLVSEQYPKGLGPTVGDLRALLPEGALCDKLSFSCTADPELRARIARAGRDQIVICGIEAHVCVLQTALGVQAAGLSPVVVADATGSRKPESKEVALDRLRHNGIEIATTEMVLFEWLGRAGTEEFRELSKLIR